MRSTLEESGSLPSGLAIVSQMDSLLKGPRVLGLISWVGYWNSFIRLFLYALLDLFQGIVGVTTIHQGVFLVSSFDLADRLKDQSLGKDDLPLPRSQSPLCS